MFVLILIYLHMYILHLFKLHCKLVFTKKKKLQLIKEEETKIIIQILWISQSLYQFISTFCYQNLQEDNNTLSLALSTLQESLKQKEKDVRELETRSRYEKHSLALQNNKLSRHIRELQAEIMLLQAKDPEAS